MRDVPGIEGPGAPDVWWVKGNAPLPENVGVADGMVRYTLIYRGLQPEEQKPTQGVTLVQLLDARRIRVEAFKGSSTAGAFTAAAKTYER